MTGKCLTRENYKKQSSLEETNTWIKIKLSDKFKKNDGYWLCYVMYLNSPLKGSVCFKHTSSHKYCLKVFVVVVVPNGHIWSWDYGAYFLRHSLKAFMVLHSFVHTKSNHTPGQSLCKLGGSVGLSVLGSYKNCLTQPNKFWLWKGVRGGGFRRCWWSATHFLWSRCGSSVHIIRSYHQVKETYLRKSLC